MNNNVLLVTIDKFDPNPIFNMHKLKPYQVSNVGFKGLATQIEEGGETTKIGYNQKVTFRQQRDFNSRSSERGLIANFC